MVTLEEREQLQRRAKSAQALALRSKIVLPCAGGADNKAVAAQLRCAQATVGKWRSRFGEHRVDALTDEAGPGRPATITTAQVEQVFVATLELTPKNATHGTAKMAERSGLRKSTVRRIWKAFELEPHRADEFKLSNDPLFVEKVHDIVGLYLNSPESAVVLSVDEKSQVKALPAPSWPSR